MKRLKFYFLVIALFGVPLSPLIFLGYSHYITTTKQLDFLIKEDIGIDQIRSINHYTLSLDVDSENINLKAEANLKLDAIRNQILSQKVFGPQVDNDPDQIYLKRLNFYDSREVYFENYRKSIGLIADHSNLILDSELDSYYLVDAMVLKWPQLLKYNESLTHGRQIHSNVQSDFLYNEFYELLHATLSSIRKSIEFQKQRNQNREENQSIENIIAKFKIEKSQKKEVLATFESLEDPLSLTTQNLLKKLIHSRRENLKKEQNQALSGTLFFVVLSLLISFTVLKYLFNLQSDFKREINEQQKTIEKGLRLATAGEVFGSIAHDIATPLQVITLSVQILKGHLQKMSPDLSTKPLALVDRIEKMTKQSDSIVKNMKTLLHDNTTTLFSESELTLILGDLKDLTQHKTAKSNVVLEVENQIGPLVLFTNASCILQILTNLINNATDAICESNSSNLDAFARRIFVKVFLNNHNLVFQVQDTGPGISSEIKEKIFESLFTTKQNSGGTGLGLTISKKMAEKLHGQLVLIDSEKGACFQLEIPRTSVMQ